MPNFIRYDKRAMAIPSEPSVSIQRSGTISLNHAAFTLAGEPEAVELLYDPDEKVIGMRPISTSEPYAFPVRRQQASRSYLIAGQAFTSYFGLRTDTALRYSARMIDDVLTVDLKKEGAKVARPSTASREKG